MALAEARATASTMEAESQVLPVPAPWKLERGHVMILLLNQTLRASGEIIYCSVKYQQWQHFVCSSHGANGSVQAQLSLQ